MRRILRDKRGLAMESALIFMTVVMCLSMLLTTGIAFVHTRVKTDSKQYQNRLVLDQIGEYFVANEGQLVQIIFDQYENAYVPTITMNNENKILALTKQGSDKIILYIEKDSANNVIQWRYSAPEQP